MKQDEPENPFWDYSLATYQQEGVAELCLQLQDSWGMDVNFLLYAAWLASLQRRLTPAHLGQLHQVVAPWRRGVLQPLRLARRGAADVADMAQFYQQLKSLELRAEQHQQALMYRVHLDAQPLPPAEAASALAHNLTLVAGQHSEATALVERLIEALAAR